ncbi:MAG TPA: alpha-glucuronidase family glycosyl hydrolase [Chryseosolibacter sp.]
MKRSWLIASLLLIFLSQATADNGYRLWLRYDRIADEATRGAYATLLRSYCIQGNSKTFEVIRKEFELGLPSLLAQPVGYTASATEASLVIGIATDPALNGYEELKALINTIDNEGFVIFSVKNATPGKIVIAGKTDIGALYGAFHFLKLLQTNQKITNLSLSSSPKIKIRILNHWDNLDRTVERGYAGASIWDWHKLPDYIDTRYHDYARANASIGINATVLTNVNANALVLTPMYLEKVKALADVFRPYGIKVYLTARFSAPVEIGGLKTADPVDADVQAWWKNKAREIYTYIPDFGGFVVKANSEGQPGPQNYGRTHADGANLLADALLPYGGVVMWRAFVYDNKVPDDRTKQAYNEFKPLDGKFKSNVIIQVKNGPLDFQPREPFHPLFGGLTKTNIMPEFQITQEYLGFSTHLAYLAPLFKECLEADTYVKGKGSTVANVIGGEIFKNQVTAFAGVANIGSDFNWTGHHFGQANWYAFGRLAWDHQLTSEAIADEWIRMTFSNDATCIDAMKSMMLRSREMLVNYMTPLGLHHIMGYNHHYGPGPWVAGKARQDWTSVYYHRADSLGVGFDRTASGSNALEQYHPEVRKQFASAKVCPEEYLLWFHHLPWDYQMKSGKTLWDDLCFRYYKAVGEVSKMEDTWQRIKGKVDEDRFNHVAAFLSIQRKEAELWRDACVLYFQSFSRKPIPPGLPKPARSLEYYMKLSFPYAPGIKPEW